MRWRALRRPAPTALAHHLYEAGTAADESRTFRALFRAGERALETRAFEEALPHFERALSLTTGADRGRRAELHWQRGLARRSLGRWEEALTDWETSLELSKELDDRDAIVRTASETAFLLNWKGRPREAAAVARNGLDLVGREAHAYQLLAEYGRALSLAADLQPGLEAIDEALELVANSGNDPRLRGDLLVRKAYHLYFCSLRPQQTEAAGEAVELLRSVGDLWNMADAVAIFNWGAVLSGTPRDADRFAADAEPLARRLGHMGAELHGRMGSGQKSWIESGDVGQLERFGRDTVEICRNADMPWICIPEAWLALAAFWRGDWSAARDLARSATEHEIESVFIGHEWAVLLLLECYLGHRDAAMAMLEERAETLLPRAGRLNPVGSWQALFGIVEGLLVLGEREAAAAHYPLIREALETGTIISIDARRLVRTVAGMSAGASGAWQEAEDHFETALAQARDLPFRSEQPEARFWYADALIHRNGPGDRDRARRLLVEAIEAYDDVEMPRHRARSEARLQAL